MNVMSKTTAFSVNLYHSLYEMSQTDMYLSEGFEMEKYRQHHKYHSVFSANSEQACITMAETHFELYHLRQYRHLSLVTCHSSALTLVACHLSLVTCHLSLVTYHLSALSLVTRHSSALSLVSSVTCRLSLVGSVACHLSALPLVTCHLSLVACHLSLVACHLSALPLVTCQQASLNPQVGRK